MRVKIILNPQADHGRAHKLRESIAASCGAFGSVQLTCTEQPGQATMLARQAAEEGFDLVVAAGGDGTVHEVVNGLVHGDKAEAALGVIPIGTGNDFAYALDIPTDLPAAIERLFAGRRGRIDLARIEDEHGRCAIVDNNVGIGFDAIVAIEAKNITRVHGFLAYFIAVMRTITLYYQTPRLQMCFDDEPVTQETLFLALGLGVRGGGGFLLTPDSRQDDGLIDSCLVNPVSRLTMVRMMPKVMSGTHVTSRHVSMRKSRRVTIQAVVPLPIHIDGEIFAYPRDNAQAVAVTVLPQAIEVIQ